ncbi:MAG: hypothetical protein AAF492_12600, partial [Verrucomicrobiota bacterium]
CGVFHFEILGREGRDRDAERLIQSLRKQPPDSEASLRAVELLKSVHRQYPAPAIKEQAHDTARVIIGASLKAAGHARAGTLMQLLRELVPQDRLLIRDTSRFLQQRQPPPSTEQLELDLVGTSESFRLPGNKKLLCLLEGGPQPNFAIGQAGRHLVALRGDWSGHVQTAFWTVEKGDEQDLLAAAFGYSNIAPLVLKLPGRNLPFLTFNYNDHFYKAIEVGTPARLPRQTIAMTYSSSGQLWVLSEWTLKRFDAQGHIEAVIDLTDVLSHLDMDIDPDRVFLISVLEDLFLANGRTLIQLPRGPEQAQVFGLPHPVTGVAISAPNAKAQFCLTMRQGVHVRIREGDRYTAFDLAMETDNPLACITMKGHIVVLSGELCRVYRKESRPWHDIRSFETGIENPLGICRSSPHHVAIVSRQGEVKLFKEV